SLETDALPLPSTRSNEYTMLLLIGCCQNSRAAHRGSGAGEQQCCLWGAARRAPLSRARRADLRPWHPKLCQKVRPTRYLSVLKCAICNGAKALKFHLIPPHTPPLCGFTL